MSFAPRAHTLCMSPLVGDFDVIDAPQTTRFAETHCFDMSNPITVTRAYKLSITPINDDNLSIVSTNVDQTPDRHIFSVGDILFESPLRLPCGVKELLPTPARTYYNAPVLCATPDYPSEMEDPTPVKSTPTNIVSPPRYEPEPEININSPPPPPEISTEDILRELMTPLVGQWESVVKESDDFEPILREMSLPYLKRKAMSSSTIGLECSFKNHPRDKRPVLDIVCRLPMGIKRSLYMYVDGEEYSIDDPDAGSWKAKVVAREIDFNGKKFMAPVQVRSSAVGHMEEARRVCQHDKIGIAMHVQYKFISNSGKVLVCNRFCRKL